MSMNCLILKELKVLYQLTQVILTSEKSKTKMT